ncbi:fibronectin type III domain-containing protein [uncultured Lacinutrix sp.]|uniref:fibronectin type III domain-containing protein n=1 Tax=uncultured Lacinutrix sp. TaxID=574032 RepID=UPI00260E953A|nr:fibronectin type III domain-containing protein [uncultured Lacinutrix sp.]
MNKIKLLFLILILTYTSQAQIYLPNETFDTGLGAWTTTDLGGANGDTWASGFIDIDASTTLNGSNCAFVDSFNNGTGTPALLEVLTSPVFNTTGSTVLLLEFEQYYRTSLPNDPDVGYVEVWDGVTWQQVLLNDNESIGAFSAPNIQSIDISAHSNAEMQIRFIYDDGGESGFYWAIDNVKVIEQITCAAPNTLNAINITDNSANLSWTETGTATSWNVELVNISAGETVTGTATTTSVTNTYAATSLLSGSTYEFYVQADCTTGDFSTWSGPFIFTTVITCPTPTNLDATNITTSSANLSWTPGSTETLWNVELVNITAGGLQTRIATNAGVTSPLLLTELPENNTYEYYVQVDCGSGDFSTWSGPFTFSTVANCIAPINLDVSFAFGNVTMSWTEGGVATLWNFQLIDITTGGTVVGASYDINNTQSFVADYTIVTPNHEYEFLVQANCAANGLSSWVGLQFTPPYICLTPPNTLTANNISNNTANLSWTETGTATSWNVELVDLTAGSTATGVPTATNVTNSYNAMGLTGDNNYEFYVQAICNVNDGPSVWSGPFAFKTLCDPFTIPYTENFEQFITSPSAFKKYNCWTAGTTTNPTNHFWESAPGTDTGSAQTGPSPAITTGNYFYTENLSLNSTAGDTAELNSPFIDLSATTAPVLIFDYHMFGTQIGTLDVIVNSTDNIFSISGQQQATETDPWINQIVDLSSYIGQTITITFRTTANNVAFTTRGDIAIDNVSFEEAPTCLKPSTLTTTNITNNTTNLGWTETSSATLWNIELVDLTAGDSATGIATTYDITNNQYTETSLAANNDYAFYVQTNCGAGDLSTWVGPHFFTTLCDPFSTPYTEDFETFTVSTNPFTNENCWLADAIYTNYFWESAPGTDTGSAQTGPSPTITTGNYFYIEASNSTVGDIAELNLPFIDLSDLTTPSLVFDYHMFGTQIGTLDVIVNGTDNVFSISGEQQVTETEPWVRRIIDLTAYTGQTVLITFRGTSNGSFRGDIAIDNVSFIERPCFEPTTLTASNITDNSADLNWLEAGIAMLWNIELVNVTAGDTPTGIATVTSATIPYMATNLTQNNNYEFYVQTDCGTSGLSNWAGPFAFTTLESCPAPTTLTATNITSSSATLGWTESGIATLWNIELVNITTGESVTGNATHTGVTNSFSITNLTNENAYAYYVQSNCGLGGVSTWTGPFNFSTEYLAVSADCTSAIFLDAGGMTGSYTANSNETTTILPDITGNSVTLTFTYVDIEISDFAGSQDGCWDYLTIYNGPDTTYPVLAQTLCGEESGDGGIPSVGTSELNIGDSYTSTDASGALTVVFFSDGSIQETGWAADVTCAPTPPANDDCSSAEALTLGVMATGNTINATDSGISPGSCGPTGGDDDIWYSFVSPVTEEVIVTTDADVVVIYDACTGNEITCIGTGVTNVIGLTSGTTYYTRVYNTGVAKVAGPIELTISESTLATTSLINSSVFSYYPNPVNNTLILNAQTKITNVTVFNILGQEVIRNTPNRISSDIDMSHLQSGSYFVKVTVGNVTETVWVIKN